MKYLFCFLAGVVLLLNYACKAPSKYDQEFSSYVTERNTRDTLLHINDSTLHLTKVSRDADYGYTAEKPVMLGMVDIHEGAANRQKFLNALRGPAGEAVTYKRTQPCCPFETPNYGHISGKKFGLLETYEVSYEGLEEPVLLYLNLYDSGEILAPKGFTFYKPEKLSSSR
jgi:hypothetical protein